MHFTLHSAVLCILILNLSLSKTVNGGLTDYLNGVKSYFGYEVNDNPTDTSLEEYDMKIPYEVSATDEKFISQAIELTGVAQSELDACQHRLILKLKSDCHQMNDMMIAKLAVGLLNCQSYIEGRKIYPCNENMSLKQCTSEMDADVWNSYHLMTNRAKAVCYAIRQTQFRGLTEHTINKLMQASQFQLHTLSKIAKEQEDLQQASKNTLKTITTGHESLAEQQKNLQQATLYGQMQLEDNIKKIADEKRMIQESQMQLQGMTKMLQEKLVLASKQIELQSKDTQTNHFELLEDLKSIQEKAQVIFQRIDESSSKLLQQTQIANGQYEITLLQLKEMNKTVHALVDLVGGTKQALEERLAWVISLLGGNDNAIDRLYVMIWHFFFLTISMVFCSFINANAITRVIVISTIPTNLVLHLFKFEQAADPILLGFFILSFGLLQMIFYSIWTAFQKNKSKAVAGIAITQEATSNNLRYQILREGREDTPASTLSRYSNTRTATPESVINAEISRVTDAADFTSSMRLGNELRMQRSGSNDTFMYVSPTPPHSRVNETPVSSRNSNSSMNLHTRGTCSAMTRLGTPCRNFSSPGRSVCSRHVRK